MKLAWFLLNCPVFWCYRPLSACMNCTLLFWFIWPRLSLDIYLDDLYHKIINDYCNLPLVHEIALVLLIGWFLVFHAFWCLVLCDNSLNLLHVSLSQRLYLVHFSLVVYYLPLHWLQLVLQRNVLSFLTHHFLSTCIWKTAHPVRIDWNSRACLYWLDVSRILSDIHVSKSSTGLVNFYLEFICSDIIRRISYFWEVEVVLLAGSQVDMGLVNDGDVLSSFVLRTLHSLHAGHFNPSFAAISWFLSHIELLIIDFIEHLSWSWFS